VTLDHRKQIEQTNISIKQLGAQFNASREKCSNAQKIEDRQVQLELRLQDPQVEHQIVSFAQKQYSTTAATSFGPDQAP
jgi:hypothetical protein